MAKLTIKSNYQWRDELRWYDLTPKEQAEFSYLQDETTEPSQRSMDATFIRYRGVVFDLGEFSSLRVTGTPEFKAWDGYHADSYFSGVLVRYDAPNERVMMATFYG